MKPGQYDNPNSNPENQGNTTQTKTSKLPGGAVPEHLLWQSRVNQATGKEVGVVTPDGTYIELQEGEHFEIRKEGKDYEAVIVGTDGAERILKESAAKKRESQHSQDQVALAQVRAQLRLAHQDERSSEGDEKEKTLEGKGLEIISKIGWKNYRENLINLPYAEFIKRQSAQIATLESQPQPQKPEWVISQENAQASERAGKLSKWMTANYGKDKSANFIAYQDGNKKLMVRGRNIQLNKDGAPTELPVTRVYLTVPTRTSPEAMRALFTTMTDEGAMANADLALNLENYQGQSANKNFENNTLVLYVYGDKPDVLSKVAKAIQRAKQESKSELWQLPAGDLAQAKKEMAADFMVPLDDTTAFVEADNLGSYHQGPRGRIYTDLTGEMPGQKIDLNKLQKSMETFTQTRPGLFDQDKNRRRYMPALILK